MPSFSFSGGVEVLGFISPTDTNDNYPVIDPLYGIDGLRNVNNLIELNSIPNPRRRAGMVVGVNGGNIYYKLNPSPWNGTITDWSVFQSGSGGTFSGGTVSGNTYFTNNLSATTFSATTYLGLPTDVFVTGGTYSNGTTIFTNNTGGTFNVVGFYTGESSYVNSIIVGTGLSANTTTGNLNIINTSPDLNVTITGGTNIEITGIYPNFGIDYTGQTVFPYLPLSGGTVTGSTNINGTLQVTTVSATTYQNLPSSGLVVGTSQIVSGTSGRILFQSGTTLQQDGSLYWDSTNKRLGLGDLGTLAARLDVKSPGNLVTDIAFRIRYSGNDRDLLKINGLGKTTFGFDTSGLDGITIDPQNAEISQTAYGGLKVMSLSNSQGYFGYGVGSFKLGIGTNSPAARLDVKSQGSLSSDIVFRLRDNTDSLNLQEFRGDGSWLHRNNTNTWYEYFDGASKIEYRRVGQFEIGTNNDVTSLNLTCNSGNLLLRGGSNIINIVSSNNYHFEESTGILPTTGAGCIVMKNRTAPSSNVTDRFYMYSNDVVAGNAVPHFRTETGDIIKLYKNANTVSIDDNLVNLGVRTVGGTSSFTNPVTINNDLTVTGNTFMPNQIAFSVYGAGTTNNLTTTQNGDGTLNTNNYTTSFYQGSGFDVTTGIFTAPIAGLYQVSLIGRNSGYSSGISQLAVLKNNSNAAGNVMMIEWAASSSMNHTGGAKIFKLAIGDTLRLKVLAGEINFDGNDNWSVAFIG